MIKTGYFLIKTITQKKILSIFIFSQLHYVGSHVVMIIWAFDGHWMKKTLEFKLMFPIGDIYLFTYPTLTKSPAEIPLPGCDNDNKWKRYLIWPENTLEPSN